MPQRHSVTVIVSYTPSEDIQKCLASLQSQTLQDIEVIIVADGFADEKEERGLKRFLQNNSNFRVIRNEQTMGKEYSRNRGILEAKGEYIGFLDEDSYANNDAFEKLYATAKKFSCDIALADHYEVAKNDSVRNHNEINSKVIKVYTGEELFDITISMVTNPFLLRAELTNKIFKKDIIAKTKEAFSNPAINEAATTLTVYLTSEKAAIIDEKLFTTNMQGGTYCRADKEKDIESLIYSTDFLKQYLLRKKILNAFYEKFLVFFYYRIFNKNIKFSLSLEKEDSHFILDKIVSEIDNNANIKKDFYRYINNNERSTERLLFSTVNNKKYYSILKLAEETEVYSRKEGGKRLQDRSKYITKNKKIVSIVTICKDIFKAKRKVYFDKMLSTVASQTYGRDNIEHIIIDGNSTDGTVEYLELISRDGTIDYWISEKDSGVYNAMNKGVKYSFGEYIIFMNTDDYFAESAIEDLVNTIEASHSDYSFANAIIIDEKDGHIGRHVGDINNVYYGSPYCHQTLLCKTSCFAEVRFDESFKITMWSYALALVTTGFKGSYIDKNLAFFRFGGISTNSSHVAEFKNEQTKIKNEMVIPMLGIGINEYEYIYRRIKKIETENIKIDAKCLQKKLIKMALNGNDFQRKFSESVLRLVSFQNN